MHLLLVISSLGGGGAERVMTRLAEAWVTTGTRVTLATFDGHSGDFYPLSPGITRRSLTDERAGQRDLLPGPLRRIRWLRSVIRDAAPDAIISFTDRTNVVTLLAAKGLRIPVIVSERIDPEMYDPGRVWSVARQVVYPSASAIVVQTRGIAQWAQCHFPRTRTVVIPNPAPENVPWGSSEERQEIIAVGRLTPQKGFDVLIEAFARIESAWPAWRLRILGEGEDRSKLEGLIAPRKLTTRIELAGRQSNAIDQIAGASIFVLSSRYEGFPNVLVEALATGRAVVATDCRSGPSDLIEDGVNGLLVPPEDPAALARGLERLMADAALRRRLGAAALAIRDHLSIGAILQQWNDLLSHDPPEVSLPAVNPE